MKPTDEQWNRWIDGQLDAQEEAELIAMQANEETAWREDRAFFHRLTLDLRRSFPKEEIPPYPEFFNSQIQKRLRDMVAAPPSIEPGVPWFTWRRWFLPLSAAAAALVLVGVWRSNLVHDESDFERSEIVYTYTPDESVHARIIYDADAALTVVRMTGIEPLPEDLHLTSGLAGVPREEDPVRQVASRPETSRPEQTPVHFTSHRRAY